MTFLTICYPSKDDSDIVYINGDWNARIGNNPDYIEGIDEISKRHNLDSTTNKHGNALLDFLKESKNYILKGNSHMISPDRTRLISILLSNSRLPGHLSPDLWHSMLIILIMLIHATTRQQ